MKKIIVLLFIAFMLTGVSAFSQKQLYIGIAGTGLSTWITNQNNYGLSEMDYSITLGLGTNLNIGYDFTKNVGIKMEIGFARLGQDYEDNIHDTAYLREINLDYLQIPLLFKFKTSGKVARFYLLAGPQFNILLNAKQKYLENENPVNRTIVDLINNTHLISKETITERFTSFDLFARFDLGVDITLVKNLVLNAGLSFGYGLMDINATDWRIKDSSGNYNASHNVYGGFNVGLCYAFDFNKGEK